MIRRYQKDDIPHIVELEKKHLLSSLEESFYLESLTNPLSYHFVIEENNKIIGFVSSIFDGTNLEILNLVIQREEQSKGYGTKLLTALFEWVAPLGLMHIFLEVRKTNYKAISFYQKLGFKIIHVRKEYYCNKEDALVMQKRWS